MSTESRTLLVNESRRWKRIRICDVVYVRAAAGGVALHMRDGTVHQSSMSAEDAATLSSDALLVQIDSRTLVNFDEITEIEAVHRARLILIMSNGARLLTDPRPAHLIQLIRNTQLKST